MRVFDLASLPPELRTQLAWFAVSDGDAPQDEQFIRRLRARGFPASDYYAVYAAEDGQLYSRVETLHLDLTGRLGLQRVVGISDVLTRPDGLGQGFARTLLEEVHRREIAREHAWSFLWTHRTWGAHRLYEKLGYEDVYSLPIALRGHAAAAGRRPPPGYRWSVARKEDAQRLERLVESATSGRLGFVPRPRGWLRIRFQLGWRKWANHRILRLGKSMIGYANLSDDSSWNLSTNEVVVTEPRHLRPMLDALEALAGRRRLTFQGTSFVRDSEQLLRERGYAFVPGSHSVLMAKRLLRGPRGSEDVRDIFRDPRFSCHRADMF
jgi:GNAT superfamily N-acetyltransferase